MICDLQKASILKRISAFLLDFILIAILATGFGALLSVMVKFNECYDGLVAYEEDYKAHGIETLLVTKEVYEKMSDEAKAYFDSVKQDVFKLVNQSISRAFLIVSLGLFFAFLVLEFVIPLCLKNGQTVGKKVFSVGVMQITGVKLKPISLFVRAILGKYALETMVPIGIVFVFLFWESSIIMFVVLLALIILQIALFFATKTFSLIHDVLSSSVVVDMQTQMIFDSTDAMLAYKEAEHLKEVEKAEYK